MACHNGPMRPSRIKRSDVSSRKAISARSPPQCHDGENASQQACGQDRSGKSTDKPGQLIEADHRQAHSATSACPGLLEVSAAKARIRAMEFRFIEEIEPTTQCLLEVYTSVVLATPYNDFENH